MAAGGRATKKNPKQSMHLGVWKVVASEVRLLRRAASVGGWGAAQRGLIGRHLATRRTYSNAATARAIDRRMTRGDLLRYRIAFALSRASKIIRGLKAG
jgi:hypothetical protein